MQSKVLMERKEVKFVTQQYECGLYVCVYDKDGAVLDQFSLDNVSEQDFHNDLRNRERGESHVK